MKPYAIGVDLGGTTVKLGLFETNGSLITKWEIPTRKEDSGTHILPDIAASIKETLQEKGIADADVEGVGIDVPGAVLADGSVNRAVNLGWDYLHVSADLGAMLGGMKVCVANDANAAALGEMWKGGGMGYDNLVMVTLGTGVGGGIVLDQKIVTGAFGAGGEIGHMPLETGETEACGCGKKGCLEQYVSATGIARMARKKLAETDRPSSLRTIAAPTAKDVFDAAKAGDEIGLELVDAFGERLGRGLAFVAAVVDPQVFVIGGGVSKAGQMVLDVIQKYYVQYAFHASRGTKFALATLGNDAGIYGAVRMVL